MHPEGVDRGTFPCSWHTCNTYTHGFTCIGKATFDDLLGDSLVVRAVAFDECHRLAQAGDIGAEDSFDELIYGVSASGYTSQIGVDHGLGSYTLIDLEPHIGRVILWVVQKLFVDVHISGFE